MLKSVESGPIDKGNLMWILSFMIGVAQMYPWNSYLTATSYFIKEFPGFPYSFAMPIAFNWSNLTTLFLMTRFGHLFSIPSRMRLGFLIAFLMLLFVPGINMITSIPEKIRIFACLAATFASGFSTAVLTGTGFGALAVLPPQYTTALMAGQGLAGVAVGGLQLILQFLVFPSMTDPQIRLSGIIFFAVAAGVIVICVVANELLLNSHFYRYYSSKAESKESSIQDMSGDESAGLISQGPITGMGVFKKIWPDALSVFLVFLVTLMLFPGFTVTIPNYDPKLGPKTLSATSKLPTILIALFQLCDFLGRSLPQWVVFIPKSALLFPTSARAVFIALWMLMNYTGFLTSNLYAYIFMIVMALTNGYFSTLAMMFGPTRVSRAESGLAGMLMAFFLQGGVFSGVHTAMILLLIIEGPSHVIQ